MNPSSRPCSEPYNSRPRFHILFHLRSALILYFPLRLGLRSSLFTEGFVEGKRPLGRSRRRWVDSIKMDLRKIDWNGIDWLELAQDRD
jgi:hypothetical protein